jgi:AcrR family transcriptional regulator
MSRGRSRDRRADRDARPGIGPPPVRHDPFGILWEEPAEEPARGRGGARGRARGAHVGREEIVRTALAIADEHGFEAVSMRRIAAELGVGTMTLYHYVPTKDDLVDLMHDEVMGELVIPGDELAGDWREALAQISRRTRDVWLRHTWLVSGMGERPHLGPKAFDHVEQSLSVVADLGLDPSEMTALLAAADDYVVGFVIREAAAQAALRRSGMDAAEYQQAMRPYVRRLLEHSDGYPSLRRLADVEFNVDAGERFEQGLQWMLDGMAAWLRRRRTDRRSDDP